MLAQPGLLLLLLAQPGQPVVLQLAQGLSLAAWTWTKRGEGLAAAGAGLLEGLMKAHQLHLVCWASGTQRLPVLLPASVRWRLLAGLHLRRLPCAPSQVRGR